jgi:RimJ/RimL family protein N-acetyltransferase
MNLPVVIRTDDEELVLRQWMAEDAARLHAFFSANREYFSEFGDDTVKRYSSPKAVQDAIANPETLDWLRLGMWRSRELIGSITLIPHSTLVGEIGFLVSLRHSGQGHATRALRALLEHALRRRPYTVLIAVTQPINVASVRVLDKAGFRYLRPVRDRPEAGIYHRTLDPREAFDSIVRDLDEVGRAAMCAPVREGYPHHTLVELVHEGDRIVRFFPPTNGTLVNAQYRAALSHRLAQDRWQLA